MEAQSNSTSALGRYWDYLFTELAGLFDDVVRVLESEFNKNVLAFIRSPNK